MNPFEILVLVLLVFFVLKCLKMSRRARQERSAEQKSESANNEAEIYREQLSQLEERIRVLERIITDDEPGAERSYRNS